MQKIKITGNELSTLARGNYQQHCVLAGDIPGVLSGAELRGKAKDYGASYAASRSALCGRVTAEHGVYSLVILVHFRRYARWCRVWVDSDGERVEFVLG